MNTLELEAYKAELAREILAEDSFDLLKKVKQYFAREKKKETLRPYTMDEINAWIDESEADEEAGTPKTSTPLPAFNGNLSGEGLTSDNSGFNGDGSATVTWTCPASGTYYFGVHCTAVWGLVYGPTAAYYFDNLSVMLKQ